MVLIWKKHITLHFDFVNSEGGTTHGDKIHKYWAINIDIPYSDKSYNNVITKQDLDSVIW